MVIKLSPNDVLQLSKMIKSGCIDTDKIEGLRLIAQNYKPQQNLSDYDIAMFKKFIRLGWGVIPTPFKVWKKERFEEMSDKHKRIVMENNGGLGGYYKDCINDIFRGILSISTIGLNVDKSCTPDENEAQKVLENYMKHRNDIFKVIICDEDFEEIK